MICGVKPTHDGGVAVIDGNRLAFSIEMEKLSNRRRHERLTSLGIVVEQLRHNEIPVDAIENLALDGWYPTGSRAAKGIPDEAGHTAPLGLAGYTDLSDERFSADPFAEVGGSLPLAGRPFCYRSYPHTFGHVFSAYCTSPFAAADDDAFILVWDGGTGALLYRFEPRTRRLANLGTVLDTTGLLYPVFASSLEPYRAHWLQGLTDRDANEVDADEEAIWWWSLSIPGKAMAYAGLGDVDEDAVSVFSEMSRDGIGRPGPVVWTTRCRRKLQRLGLPDASLMASFQEFLYRSLEQGLKAKLGEIGQSLPLCFAGGCALNIKFNARLRASGLFNDVWVPPFPNDSGSAIGMACTEMVRTSPHHALSWSVFSGPALRTSDPLPAGWTSRPCSPADLADHLYENGQPVVVLSGRAELGPRALGHRSILAPATERGMHDHLNHIKNREGYRPVAPICLEDRAEEVFHPGVRDPYMLFDHAVRPEWAELIPAVVHADGTARLQTVGPDNELMHTVLTRYYARSGIPVLCNTSANFAGCGFFPDVASAMQWNRIPLVWAENVLYARESP